MTTNTTDIAPIMGLGDKNEVSKYLINYVQSEGASYSAYFENEKDAFPDCVYIDNDGNRCFVGKLLSESTCKMMEEIEFGGWTHNYYTMRDDLKRVEDHHGCIPEDLQRLIDMLSNLEISELQSIHDNSLESDSIIETFAAKGTVDDLSARLEEWRVN